MADVLRAVKNAESQTGKKIARRQIASNRSQLESGFSLQKHVDVLQLWQVVFTVAAILDQLRPVFHELGHGVLQVEFLEFAENDSPVTEKRISKINLMHH